VHANNTRPTIAVVSHMYPMRGREQYGVFVAEQTRALVTEGVDVCAVIAPVPAAPWPLPALSAKWRRYAAAERRRTDFVSVDVVLPRYLSFPRKLLRGLSAWTAALAITRDRALETALRRASVVIAHTALLDGRIARALARRRGVPFVVFVHGEDLYQNVRGPQGRRLGPAVGAVLVDAAAVIAVSEPVADGLAEAFPALPRARVLPNGVDTATFSPGPALPEPAELAGPLRILSAGYLVRRKAHAYVLRAIAQLAAAGIAVDYTVAGDGPERATLETLAAELGLSAIVHFTGAYAHGDLPGLLRATDLFVLPGWDEAFGVVYLESLACGVPVVAASDGGARTIVTPGIDGYLVPARDEDAIASAIRSFAALPQEARRAMHDAARETALGYTWTANARGLMAIVAEFTD